MIHKQARLLRLAQFLYPEIFNHRVGKNVARDLIDFRPRLLPGCSRCDFNIEIFALPHVCDGVMTLTVEGRPDRLSLWVQHRGF